PGLRVVAGHHHVLEVLVVGVVVALAGGRAGRQQDQRRAAPGRDAGAEPRPDRVRLRGGGAGAVGERQLGVDHAPLLLGLRGHLAQIDAAGVIERLAGVARQPLVARGQRVVDLAVAVVVEVVAGGVERARVDELGPAALGGVAAVAGDHARDAAGGEPVVVGVHVLVDHAVAVVVDAVAAVLGGGQHLAHAGAPHALVGAGGGALLARADAGGALLAVVARGDLSGPARPTGLVLAGA